MEHSQRTVSSDSCSLPTASSSLMPNVLFREIHKNAFLKRHSSDRRTGFPRKSEKVWVVFCVHDDVEPFLEIYPDQKVALTHKPEWFTSLSNVLHVSPTICGHEDEFEFAVTLSFQVVRLAAPSWDSMMEWVETIRNKLRELKVLCPKENLYSKMPEQKMPLLPTRDPNSPLPLPPEGPSTLLPGVELVHLESRNNSSSTSNGDATRHQRDVFARNGVTRKRAANERDRRPVEPGQPYEVPTTSSSSSSSSSSGSGSPPEINAQESDQVLSNAKNNFQKNKIKTNKNIPVSQPTPSTSNCSPGPNVTVIEVSSVKDNTAEPETNSTFQSHSAGGIDDIDRVVVTTSDDAHCATDTNSGETHYEHVFLPNVLITKQQLQHRPDSNSKAKYGDFVSDKSKPHSTSVLINSNASVFVGSSQNESVAGTSNFNSSSISNNAADILAGGSTCVNLGKGFASSEAEKTDSNASIEQQMQMKLEKVNISGLIPRVPAKSARQGGAKLNSHSAKDLNLNIVESKKCSNESPGPSHQPTPDTSEFSNEGISHPYGQVKKIQKIKIKNEDLRNGFKNGSSGFSQRKSVENLATEVESPGRRHEQENVSPIGKNLQCSGRAKPSKKVTQKAIPSKKAAPSNVNIVNDAPGNSERNQTACDISNGQFNDDLGGSAPSTSGGRIDDAKPNPAKKEPFTNFNNNPEVEPMTATVQPAAGVISVEDIPLIGGHQRRRRRSSSSDAPSIPNNPTSRVMGGADRIRINVPLSSSLPVREEHRSEGEPRSSSHSRNISDQIVHVSVPLQASRLTLREQQVLQLKKEMLHPGGVRLQLRRKDCTGSIALVDALNGVWVAGWKQKEHPLLYNALHIGDQLVSVSDVAVRTSADAHKLIRSSTSLYLEFIIRRVPFGNVFALQRSSEGQNLGIIQEGNTAEIREVLPNSIAARQGLTSKTPSCDGLSLTTWFLTEINGRPLNLFFKETEVRDRLNAVGKEISILVQPHDFIKQIKKQLKNIRGYKDYIVQ